MKFQFDRPACQNLRKALRKEWLETNGLGDYASSSLVCCNTRKYHGLFVTELARPAGRHVLLSTLEESLLMAGKEFFFSCRKHPGVYFPRGHEYMQAASAGLWPSFRYRFGDVTLTRELMLLPGRHVLLIRYKASIASPETPPLRLRIKPLLACRNMHAVIRADKAIDSSVSPTLYGASVRPDPQLPELFLQMDGPSSWQTAQDWYYNIEYLVEQERGFPFQEDLFMPGIFEVDLVPGHAVYLTVSTESLQKEHSRHDFERLWQEESQRRIDEEAETDSLQKHLAREGKRFLIATPGSTTGRIDSIVAGYHWFGSWGRDTMIALPGLTFFAGRQALGEQILANMGAAVRDGLIPNVFSADGRHAYNSVDASLWYVWAVQMLLQVDPQRMNFVKEHCWPAIKEILRAYAGGQVPFVRADIPSSPGWTPWSTAGPSRRGTASRWRSAPCGTMPWPLPTIWHGASTNLTGRIPSTSGTACAPFSPTGTGSKITGATIWPTSGGMASGISVCGPTSCSPFPCPFPSSKKTITPPWSRACASAC